MAEAIGFASSISASNFSVGSEPDFNINTFSSSQTNTIPFNIRVGFWLPDYNPYTLFDIYAKLAVTVSNGGNNPYAILSYSVDSGASYITIQTFNTTTAVATYGPIRTSMRDSQLLYIMLSSANVDATNTVSADFYEGWLECWYSTGGFALFNTKRNRH